MDKTFKFRDNKLVCILIIVGFILLSSVSLMLLILAPSKIENNNKVSVSYVLEDNVINKELFLQESMDIDSAFDEPIDFPMITNKYFEGWYLDGNFSNKANFPIRMNESKTLYAKFLDANLPKDNISFNTLNQEYFICGTLESTGFTTLIIPDIYDDGVNGTKILSSIVNVSSNIGLLTNNRTITKLYVGNNIHTITEYFAYNSVCESLVVGRNVTEIAGNAFQLCTALTETTFSPSGGWYDVTTEDIVNSNISWLRTSITIKFVTNNILLINEGLDGTATNSTNEAFKKQKYSRSESPVKLQDTSTFPTTVNYRFEGWCTDEERTDLVDFTDFVVTKNTTLYAKYRKGNIDNYIEWDGTKNTYYVDNSANLDTTTFTDTIFVIPDIYDDGIHDVNAVTYIEENASYVYALLCGNVTIESIFFGNNILSIGDYFAYRATGLKTIYFSNYTTMETIAYQCFYYCENLEGTLKLNINVIEAFAFEGCGKVTGLVFGEQVKSINYQAFTNLYSLESFVYNAIECSTDNYNSNPYFFQNAGRDSGGFTLTIGKNVKKIPDCLFCDEGNRTIIGKGELIIPEKVEVIEEIAFSALQIESVIIGENVKEIGKSVFSNNLKLNKITYNAIDCEDCANNSYIFPELTDGVSLTLKIGAKVTRIPSNLFSSVSNYRSGICGDVDIPDSVTSIGDYAFYCLANITSITIGNGVETIGQNAFAYASGITSITIGESVKEMGEDSFGFLTNVTLLNYNAIKCADFVSYGVFDKLGRSKSGCKLTIGKKVNRIPAYLFYIGYVNGTPKISGEVVIPDSVESIGEYSFMGTYITDLSIGEGVTSIERNAFYELETSLNSLTFNAIKCETFFDFNFGDSSSFSVAIGYKVTIIPDEFLWGEDVEGTVIIPDSVEYIGDYAFAGCDRLDSIKVGNGVITIGKCAFASSGITQITLGCNVKTIKDEAFYEAKITSLELPASLSEIGKNVFRYSSLSSITFEDLDGWTLSDTSGMVGSTTVVVSDASANATNFRTNSNYYNKYLVKDNVVSGEW